MTWKIGQLWNIWIMIWKIGNEAGHQQLWNIWNEEEAGHQQLSHMVKDTCSSKFYGLKEDWNQRKNIQLLYTLGVTSKTMVIL